MINGPKAVALAALLALMTTAVSMPAGPAGAQGPVPGSATPVPAQTGEPAPPVPQDAQIGLKVAPDRYTGTIAPGESKDGVIDLFNVGRQTLRIRAAFENVRMTGDDGTLEFYVGENPFRLHSFVEFPEESFTIAPGEARRVSFRINVPEGIFPGGYFGSMLFRAVPVDEEAEGTSVAQGGQVGTLFVITVSGDADVRGELTAFDLVENGFGDTKGFEAVWKNTGNTDDRPLGVAYEPEGTLRVRNTLGLGVAEREVTGPLVFPGAERRLEASADKPLWFGRYTAELRLKPPRGGQESVREVSFWAISPLGAALAGLFVLVLVVLVLWIRGRRKHRHRQGGRSHQDHQGTGWLHEDPPGS
ncbi:MAG: hypothetical protein WD603_03755 [Patescibacteria group bacterium]